MTLVQAREELEAQNVFPMTHGEAAVLAELKRYWDAVKLLVNPMTNL